MSQNKILGIFLVFVLAISAFLYGCAPQEFNNSTQPNFNTGLEIKNTTPNINENTIITPAEPQKPEKPIEIVKPSESAVQRVVIKEGQKVKLSANLLDPDKKFIKVTFSSPINGSGMWQTKTGDAGTYDITVTASDGTSVISKTITLVVESLNKAPVLGKIQEINVREGEAIEIKPIAVDPDGDNITISYSGWMNSPSYLTKFGDAGQHIVIVTASDLKLQDQQTVKINVQKVNRAPELRPIVDIVIFEGEAAMLKPTAYDPDNEPVTFVFQAPFNDIGTWQTKVGDAGTYKTVVKAYAGNMSTQREVTIIVKKKNHAPSISTTQDSVSIGEGNSVNFTVSASDVDNDSLKLKIYNLPLGARFNEVTNEFRWSPEYSTVTPQEGSKTFTIKFEVTDGELTTAKEVPITVQNVLAPGLDIGVTVE